MIVLSGLACARIPYALPLEVYGRPVVEVAAAPQLCAVSDNVIRSTRFMGFICTYLAGSVLVESDMPTCCIVEPSNLAAEDG